MSFRFSYICAYLFSIGTTGSVPGQMTNGGNPVIDGRRRRFILGNDGAFVEHLLKNNNPKTNKQKIIDQKAKRVQPGNDIITERHASARIQAK